MPLVELEFTYDKETGKFTVEGVGQTKGQICTKTTDKIMAAAKLVVKSQKRKLKKEYYAQAQTSRDRVSV